MFTPITEAQQVPRPGTGFERLTLDMKASPRAYGAIGSLDYFEVAKDMAALANAQGGSLLIGVKENRANGTVDAICPLSDAEILEVQKMFPTGAENKLRPMPLFEVEQPIVLREGRIMVVNVWPSFGQLVGVIVKGVKDADGYGGNTYAFPVRAAAQTTYVAPEQFAMFMMPQVRRNVFLLQKLNEGDVLHLIPYGDHENVTTWKVGKLDDINNSLELQREHGRSPIAIPISAIEHVWRSDGKWFARLDRVIVKFIMDVAGR